MSKPQTEVKETKEPVVETKPQTEVKSKKNFYFRNTYYSGLKILVRGGEDDLGALGVKHTARFVPYYDTWKGDVVRVGYLETDRVDVAELCRADSRCEEIDEKEFKTAVVGDEKHPALRRAPLPMA